MKAALFSFVLVLTSSVSFAASVDLGTSAGSTPYDAYMRPVKQVLGSLNGSRTSMDKVKVLMREGRSFRYSFTDPYNAALPATTESVRAGDCKAKSLWLCDKIGDDNVRYVVGKARRTSKMSHAWVMWQDQGRWWILDCTNTSKPIAADSVSKNEYIPLYSWSKGTVYRHASTSLFMADVAGKGSSPVAAQQAD